VLHGTVDSKVIISNLVLDGKSKQRAQTPVPWIQIRLAPGSNSNASSRYMTLAMADTTVCYVLYSASSSTLAARLPRCQWILTTLRRNPSKEERNEANFRSVCRCKCSSMYPPRPFLQPLPSHSFSGVQTNHSCSSRRKALRLYRNFIRGPGRT